MMGKSLCCTKDCKSLRWTKHQRLVVGILHGGQGIFIKIQRQDIVRLFSHSTGQGVGHEVCREAARTDLKRGGARRILGELKVKVTVTRLLYFICLLPAHCPANGTKESRKGREACWSQGSLLSQVAPLEEGHLVFLSDGSSFPNFSSRCSRRHR